MKYQILGLHNSGTNLLAEILNNLNLDCNISTPSKGSTILWKHTLNIEEIIKLQQNKNIKIIILLRNPFFWFQSFLKTYYINFIDKKNPIFKRELLFNSKIFYNEKDKYTIHFNNLIELFNYYITIYEKLNNKDNCFFISYEEIIYKTKIKELFNFLNINYTNDMIDVYNKTLKVPSKKHGNPTNFSTSLIKNNYKNIENIYTKDEINQINNLLNNDKYKYNFL